MSKRMLGFSCALAIVAARAPSGVAEAGTLLDDPVLIAGHVKTHAERLDWATVFSGPERLIYLGEVHPDVRPKQELVRHMQQAAAAGITHLAIEMLGEDSRELLSRYERRQAPDSELVQAFSSRWGPADRGFMPEEYARVASAAREAGIRIEPLDMSIADKSQAWEACMARGSEEQCDGEELRSRDNRMMSNLAVLLSKPEAGRVLAWVGGWHACALEQAAGLAARGIPSRSYYMASRGRYERDSGIIHYMDAVAGFGWARDRLLIRTQGVQACFAGLISLPDEDVPPALRDP